MVKYKDHGNIYLSDTCVNPAAAADRGELILNALARDTYPGDLLSEEELPGVKTIGYWDAHKSQTWGLDWHRNEGIEITFLMNGHLDFLLNDVVHQLKANDLTITRPWQPHKLGNPDIGISKLFWIIVDNDVQRPNQEWRWPHWILLSADEMKELTRYLRENEHPVWETTSKIREIFGRISQTIDESLEKHNITYLAILINELLYSLLAMFRTYEIPLKKSLTSNQRNVEVFLSHLEVHLGMEWTVEEMAEECEIGKTRFIDYCKQIKNMTPSQYLTFLRVERASESLCRETETSILNIALDCGFSSSQYFASCFKKQKSVTPSDYRSERTKKPY
jgi:AraC-like DNA-binding protein